MWYITDIFYLSVIIAATSLMSFVCGGLFTRAIYDDFNRRLIIYVEAGTTEVLKKPPAGAVPVWAKGKIVFYIMEKK